MDWLELGKLAIVGVVSGLFSSLLAYRAHRQKKWWELRVAAYQEVIAALSDLVHYYSYHYNYHIERRDINDDQEKLLRNFWDEAYPKVRRAADAGAFIFSSKVNEELMEYINVNNERPEFYFEYLESNLYSSKKCLKEIVSSSKYDLKTKWWWL